jgi:co-chaperonin GroES (HSP10)
MQPTRDNIIVERLAAEKVSPGGLILKTTDGPDKGRVIALGPKVDEVEVGDEVLLNWVKAVKVSDEQYVVPITEVIFIY